MLATYDYQCSKCYAVFELRRDWNTACAVVNCPVCHRADVHRLFSPIVMLSRGTGGSARVIGGSACGSCTGTRCGSCALARPRRA